MRIVTAGTQMQAEAGLIQDIPGDQCDQCDHDLKGIEICEYGTQHRNLRQHRHGDAGGYAQHKLIGSSPEDAGIDLLSQKFCQSHSQNIDHDTADYLIGFEFNAEHSVQQREKHTAQEGKQHSQIEGDRGIAGKILCDTDCEQCTAESAKSLQAFDSQIGDAAALTVDSADRHDKER